MNTFACQLLFFSVAKLPDPHTGDGYPETVVVVTGLTLGRGGIGT